MGNPLKVKILKKSKDVAHPEHIIVERPETYEMVHLYFDDGYLARLTHIKRNPEIKMAWHKSEKRYKALLSNYSVIQDIVFKKDKENHLRESTYLKGPENQSLFAFSVSPIFNQSTICFYSYPKSSGDFFVEMDLNDRCVPNHYIGPLSSADIKEIYPHQKCRVAPLKHFFERKER